MTFGVKRKRRLHGRGRLRDLSSAGKWLGLTPIVMLLLLVAGKAGSLSAPAPAQAETRSKLRADYGPWTHLVIRPISTAIIAAIRADAELYPDLYPSSGDGVPISGVFWPSPGTSSTATPPLIPTTWVPPSTMTAVPSASPTITPAVPGVTPTPAPSLTPTSATSTPAATPSSAPSPTSTRTPFPWHDANWRFRKKITIAASRVAGDPGDFPVLISLPTDVDLAADAQDDGDDILFTRADGQTKLAHEIDRFNGGNGELVAWVKVPSLSSSSDTVLYLYYGHPGAANQQNPAAVWDAQFVGVWHLGESSGSVRDSTSSGNNGTAYDGAQLGASGRADGAAAFNGSTSYIDIGSPSALALSGQGTLEGWVRWDALNTYDFIVGKTVSGTAPGISYGMAKANTGRMRVGVSDGATSEYAVTGVNSFMTGQWYYFAGRWNGSSLQMFLDGSPNGQPADQTRNAQVVGSHEVHIGCGWSDTCTAEAAIDGIIDEVRISNCPRSDAWIATTYNTVSSPGTFFSMGMEEIQP